MLLHVTPFNPWFLKVFSLSQYVRKLYCKVGWFCEFLVHRNGMHCVHTTLKSHMVNVDETKSFFLLCCCVCCQFGWPYRLNRNDFSISQNWTRKRSNKTDEKNRYLKVVCNGDSSVQITYISYTDTALCTYLTPPDFSLFLPFSLPSSLFLSFSLYLLVCMSLVLLLV